jgi:hypothetical protein
MRFPGRRGGIPWGEAEDLAVKNYFLKQVGTLLTPPMRRLEIQAQTADVEPV